MSRLTTHRGLDFQAPNTYKIETSNEQKLATGLDNIFFDFNRDGSYSVDIELNFLFADPASDFATSTEWFKIAGDYKELTSDLPASVGTQITDSWIAPNEDEFIAFEQQLISDVLLELKLK